MDTGSTTIVYGTGEPRPGLSWTVQLPQTAKANNASIANNTAPPAQPSQPVYKVEQNNADMAIYQSMDTSQALATPGEAVPIVFGRRVNGVGGVWISPKLLAVSCYNFQLSYLYIASQGELSSIYNAGGYPLLFVGKRNSQDVLIGYRPTFGSVYSSSTSTCPAYLSSLNMSCSGATYKYFAGELGIDQSSKIEFKTYGNYVTAVVLRIRTVSESAATASARYQITLKRRNNATGTTTTTTHTIGGADGNVDTITLNSLSAANYSFVIESPTQTVVDPDGDIYAFLVEAEQTQTAPTSVDYTADFARMQMYGIANLNMGRLDDVVTLEDSAGNITKYATKLPLQNKDLKQVHAFVDGGLIVTRWSDVVVVSPGVITVPAGPSNKFMDLVAYVIDNVDTPEAPYPRYGRFEIKGISAFHQNYDMFFNGVIYQSTNLISYVQQISLYFLISFVAYGRFWNVYPLLPLTETFEIDTGVLTTDYTFTDVESQAVLGTITPGTYRKVFKSVAERAPFIAVMTYREQNPSYPEPLKTVKVRFSDYPSTAPEELYDMSEFCANRDHAILIAKYILATRRYEDATVEFQTARGTGDLYVNNMFEIELKRTNSTGDDATETEHYLATSIINDPTGIATISGRAFPLGYNNTDASIISNAIINGSFAISNA
jgi:hypothetical protein